MELVGKRGLGRYFLAPLLALLLILGYVAYTHIGSGSPARPGGAPAPAPAPAVKKLTAADAFLAASTAKGIHLEFDTVTGPPSTVHTNHANITSFKWGVSAAAPTIGSGGSAGKANVAQISLTKSTDKYTLPLLAKELKGQTTANAIVYFTGVTSTGTALEYLEFDLKNVNVTNLSMSSATDIPSESLSLAFTAFTIKAHIPGAVAQTLTYNIATNTTT